MTTYGLTTTGFVQKTVADLKAEVEAALRASFGNSIDLSPQSVFGQLVGVLVDRLADLWSLGGAVHAAFTPDGASGTSLDDLAAITGTVRLAAVPSDVFVYAAGTVGTLIPSGSVVTVGAAGTRFVTTVSYTLAAAALWTTGTAYDVGAMRQNGGNAYLCTVAGTSGAGPSGTGTAIVDGTCTWRFMASSTGTRRLYCVSEDNGPLAAPAYTLDTIGTPVAGWTFALNVLDATPGRYLESDAALRIRRELEIRTSGKASLDAIRAALIDVDDVTSARVFENPTDVTDVNGLPPHSIEALVTGGADADVAASVFSEKAAGIATYGSSSEVVTDAAGGTHTVYFSRPTPVPIYVTYNLTVDLAEWPADGAAQVQAALVAWGDAQVAGKDVVSSAAMAQAFKVLGVLDGVALLGTAPSPTLPTTIAINMRQLATYDTSRVVVTATGGTP